MELECAQAEEKFSDPERFALRRFYASCKGPDWLHIDLASWPPKPKQASLLQNLHGVTANEHDSVTKLQMKSHNNIRGNNQELL